MKTSLLRSGIDGRWFVIGVELKLTVGNCRSGEILKLLA